MRTKNSIYFSTLNVQFKHCSFSALLHWFSFSVWVGRPSVQFSRSFMSDSLRPHELQHARSPCPSPTPGVHSDSRPSSQWCHPAISSSGVPVSSCPHSLPASESFPMSQLFAWCGQSTLQSTNILKNSIFILDLYIGIWASIHWISNMSVFHSYTSVYPFLHRNQKKWLKMFGNYYPWKCVSFTSVRLPDFYLKQIIICTF